MNLPLQDSRPDGRSAVLGLRRAFASDTRRIQGLRKPLNTAEHRVVRRIGNGDRALSAARPVTRRAPRGDPDDQLEDRAGLALAALQNRYREAQPGAVAFLGSRVTRLAAQWQVYKDNFVASHG